MNEVHTGPGIRILRREAVSSTQDEATGLLASGARPPFAVSARTQTRGRGRLGRTFVSPPGSSLSLTLAHATSLPPARRSWLPLVAGLAARDALAALVGPAAADAEDPPVGLKWPNDLHTADGRKLGGILVEGRGEGIVLIGIGLNLRGPVRDADGAVVPGAAWLLGADGEMAGDGAIVGAGAGAGAEAERTARVRRTLEEGVVRSLARDLALLEDTDGDARGTGIADRYAMACLTVGRTVRVEPLGPVAAEDRESRSAARTVEGVARGIDERGRLVLDLADGRRAAVDIGDIRHLRAGADPPSTEGAPEGAEQEEHSE